MSSASRPGRFTALSLILAPACLLAATVISPSMATDNHRQLDIVSRAPDRQYISAVFALVALALLVAAALALRTMLRPHHPRLANAGLTTMVVGVVATAMSTGLGLLEWQMVLGKPGRSREAMVALLDQLEHATGMGVLFFLGAFVSVSVLIYAAGLARARTIPAWMAGTMALGTIVLDLGFTINNLPTGIAGAAIMTVGMGAVGALELRRPRRATVAPPSASPSPSAA